MNCGEIKDLIIEYNGKLESAKLKPEVLAEANSHLASCKKCALAKERMTAMTAKLADDKVEIPANLAADIISRVIPSAEQARPKIKAFPQPERGFIDKLAELFGMSSNKFAFAMSAVFLGVIAISLFVYGYGMKAGDQSGKIADNKNIEINENIIKDPVDKKFKKIDGGDPKNVASKDEEIDKKFKKSIFTVESGAVANLTGEYKLNESYQVKQGEDLSINYKKVAQIIIKTNSKFKVNDEGIILESGMVSVDLKPKSLAGFKVLTPESVVEVVGTVFSVSSSDNKTEVIVKRGCVKVTDLKTKEIHTLNAGDSKTVSASGEAKIDTAPVVIQPDSNTAAVNVKKNASGAAASTSEVSHTAENGTAPAEIKGANIKDIMNSFKNENVNPGK
jgi:hypothetical protein